MKKLTIESIKINPIAEYQLKWLNIGVFFNSGINRKFIQCIKIEKELKNELFLIDLRLIDKGFIIVSRNVEKIKLFVQDKHPFLDEQVDLYSRYVYVAEYELKKYRSKN